MHSQLRGSQFQPTCPSGNRASPRGGTAGQHIRGGSGGAQQLVRGPVEPFLSAAPDPPPPLSRHRHRRCPAPFLARPARETPHVFGWTRQDEPGYLEKPQPRPGRGTRRRRRRPPQHPHLERHRAATPRAIHRSAVTQPVPAEPTLDRPCPAIPQQAPRASSVLVAIDQIGGTHERKT